MPYDAETVKVPSADGNVNVTFPSPSEILVVPSNVHSAPARGLPLAIIVTVNGSPVFNVPVGPVI